MMSGAGRGGLLLDATVTFTPAGAGALTAASATLPAGQVGYPVAFDVTANISGYITLQVLAQQVIAQPFSANAPPVSKGVPAGAYPFPVNSVLLGGFATAAGSIAVVVHFRSG